MKDRLKDIDPTKLTDDASLQKLIIYKDIIKNNESIIESQSKKKQELQEELKRLKEKRK